MLPWSLTRRCRPARPPSCPTLPVSSQQCPRPLHFTISSQPLPIAKATFTGDFCPFLKMQLANMDVPSLLFLIALCHQLTGNSLAHQAAAGSLALSLPHPPALLHHPRVRQAMNFTAAPAPPGIAFPEMWEPHQSSVSQ